MKINLLEDQNNMKTYSLIPTLKRLKGQEKYQKKSVSKVMQKNLYLILITQNLRLNLVLVKYHEHLTETLIIEKLLQSRLLNEKKMKVFYKMTKLRMLLPELSNTQNLKK